MVSRRGFIAGAGAAVAGAAGTVYALFDDDDGNETGAGSSNETEGTEQNSSDEKAPQRESNRSGNETGGNTSEETNASQNGTGNASDEPEYPEAAEPEANPEVETNETVGDYGGNETVNETDPTPGDLAITSTEISTSSRGAEVSGRLTNEADVAITVDLKVTFLQNGKQLGRPALGGTTGLEPAGTWDFTIRARGSEYSEADDYEIEATNVSRSMR